MVCADGFCCECVTFNWLRLTYDPWPYDPWPLSHDPWSVTLAQWPLTSDPWYSTLIPTFDAWPFTWALATLTIWPMALDPTPWCLTFDPWPCDVMPTYDHWPLTWSLTPTTNLSSMTLAPSFGSLRTLTTLTWNLTLDPGLWTLDPWIMTLHITLGPWPLNPELWPYHLTLNSSPWPLTTLTTLTWNLILDPAP